MEALYQSFVSIPIELVGHLGLFQMILIAGVVIFRLCLTKPEK